MAKEPKYVSIHPQWYSEAMTPDATFVRQIQEIDKAFYPRWCWARGKWEIWYKKDLRPDVLAMVVQNDDSSFRPLDQRTILRMRIGDSHRYNRKRDLIYEIETKEERANEIREKDGKNRISSITKHFDKQLRGVEYAQVPDQIS